MTQSFIIFLVLVGVREDCVARLQPNGGTGEWLSIPSMHAPLGSRSTETTIMLSWTWAEHEFETIDLYEVQVRFPTEVAESENIYLPKAASISAAYPESIVANREWAVSWSPWYTVYSGPGRQFLFDKTQQLGGPGAADRRYFDFQVRAVTRESTLTSDWSPIVQGYTILEGSQDRVLLELVGTGRNNAGYTKVVLGDRELLNRSDLIGLTLLVIDRQDLSVVFIQTYNTFEYESESLDMARKILSYGPDYFIVIVSSGAWEWHATPVLTDALERYGGYYVGQWSRVFTGTSSLQYSPYADLAETASEDSFGHPYAFVGRYGFGAGGGYESLQLNTGHYLVTGKAERAIIRLELYYNYMFGRYMIGTPREGKKPISADWFVRGQAPRPHTLHAPLPKSDTPVWQIQTVPPYVPYVGSLWAQLEYIMESNQTYTVPEYNVVNYGFEILQNLDNRPDQISDDPRVNVMSELDRIWGGPSLRYSADGSGDLLPASVTTGTDRICPDILENRLSPGVGCPDYDTSATAGIPLLQAGVGMWPTICDTSGTNCGSPISTSFPALIAKPIDITDISTDVTSTTDTW